MTRKTTRKFGLIGYPITHSFSPGYFSHKFESEGILDADYSLYPLSRIEEFLALKGMTGVNVTIPYKEQVIPYLDNLSKDARAIGAVNTIKYTRTGETCGYNTDCYGFQHSLLGINKDKPPRNALVLGTGGAAKAVWYVLNQLEVPFSTVSRSKGDLQYSDLTPTIIADHQLIVNTTPLGMAPKIDACPEIPYEALSSEHILYDLIYNPEKTLFLIKGEASGATIKNGLEMLQLQAEKAWEIWNSPSL